MKTSKVTFAAIAAIGVALSLAVAPALTNQVFAQDFPGSQGRGHQTTTETTCTQTASGSDAEPGPCPGNSWKSKNKDETTTTTTTAGKSHVVKDESSTTR